MVGFRSLFCAGMAMVWLAGPPAAWPQNNNKSFFFALADVRPGLQGIGKTVFSGSRIEEFQVEILGVLQNVGPKQSIILARLSGGPLERTGVMQGMSGSPVYIDGKLVGALAMAFPFSKEPIAGIRPIQEMLEVQAAAPERGRRGRLSLTDKDLLANFPEFARSEGGGEPRLIDIATPISFSGFSSRTIDQFSPILRAIGLEPRQAISGGVQPESARVSPEPLQPGSMITVQLLSGDMSMGADGTVTYLDGNRVLAFGHRFLSVGSTELPFARASVIALLPNLSTSFKISSTGDWLGSITSDRSAGVAGELGRRAPMVPLTIRVNGPEKQSSYRMEMVQDQLLSPLLLQMSLYSALEATERTLGAASMLLRGRVDFENLPEPVRIDNMYSGDFNVPLQAALSTALPVAYALQNNLGALRLKSIDLTVDSFPEKKQMHIDQVWASKREVRPGEIVDIMVVLTGENRREVTKRIPYKVPIGAPAGTLHFTVGDALTVNTADHRYFGMTEPRPAEEVVAFLNSLRTNTKGYIRVWRPDPAYNIEGRDLPDPPPSVAMILAKTHGSSVTGQAARTSRKDEIEFSVGDVVVAGSRTIQVEVKE